MELEVLSSVYIHIYKYICMVTQFSEKIASDICNSCFCQIGGMYHALKRLHPAFAMHACAKLGEMYHA